jgi:hypothetical protein
MLRKPQYIGVCLGLLKVARQDNDYTGNGYTEYQSQHKRSPFRGCGGKYAYRRISAVPKMFISYKSAESVPRSYL